MPTTVDIHQVPAKSIPVGTRISVRLINYRGVLPSYGSHFLIGSVAEYAKRYREDPVAAVAEATARGHKLYYAIAEAVVLSAHKQPYVERVELELGTIIETDGKKFQILQAPNENLALVPLTV